MKNEIRIDLIYKLVVRNWKRYISVMLLAAVVSAFVVLCIPRYYSVRVLLAPEYNSGVGATLGAMGSITSMFGVDLGNVGSQDAITPQFYPDIISSTEFLVPLLDVEVETSEKDYKGSYMGYIINKEKSPWWSVLKAKIISIFKKNKESLNLSPDYKINPFELTKPEYDLIKSISSSINCSVDTKTDVITIIATAQDPLVAAMLANAVKEHLQKFIIKYRTEKTSGDLKYNEELCDKAYKDYIKAQRAYAEYVDKHRGLSQQMFRVEEERLDGEKQLAFNMYNTLNQQRILSAAKLQERTPAFTTLYNASVPLLPAGPKRTLIVFFMMILSALAYTVYLVAINGYSKKVK